MLWISILCVFLSAVCVIGSVFALSGAVVEKTRDRILTMEELQNMGERFDHVIVLGCLVHSDGRLSDRLAHRVATGIEVMETGLCDTLLMSGDRQEDGSYDEVGAMQHAAIEAGVSVDVIEIDPEGYSTYESILRLSKVYGGERVIIVTQTYHLHRALYIADKLGIEAYGVSADRRSYSDQFKCEAREVAARIKDVFLVQLDRSWNVS